MVFVKSTTPRNGDGLVREHQMKFVGSAARPVSTLPLLLVEFRCVPGAAVRKSSIHGETIGISIGNIS
jgi:hypothetical protein